MNRTGLRPAMGVGLAVTLALAGAPGFAVLTFVVPSFAQDTSPPSARDKAPDQAQPQPSVPPAGPPQNGVIKPPDVDPKMTRAAPDVDPKMAKRPAPMTEPQEKPDQQPPVEAQPKH